MAVEFMDSADHYNQDASIGLKWTLNGAKTTPDGRNGRGIDLGQNGFVSKTVSYRDGWIVGYAFRFTTNAGGHGNMFTIWHAGAELLGSVFLELDQTLSLYGGQVRNLIFNSGTLTPPIMI